MKRALNIALVGAIAWGAGLTLGVPLALAQSDAGVPPADASGAADDDAADDEEDWDDEEPQLRPPTLDMGGSSTTHTAASDEEDEDDVSEDEEDLDEDDEEDEDTAATTEEEEDEEDEALPSPEHVAQRLDGAGTDPTVAPWSTPQTVFEMHGYMRMRGEFQDTFFLGRDPSVLGGTTDLPFSRFIPAEDRLNHTIIAGGCDGGHSVLDASGNWSQCSQHALAFANMRFRMEPTIYLSDDVRIHAQIDVFDNLVMGSTPDGYAVDPQIASIGGAPTTWTFAQSNYVPLLALSQTQQPPTYGQNSLIDSIRARRAWAEVRNRGLGEIRFGRMGQHWGLGILANDGRGIDQDFQSDVDRIMAITRILGFYVFGAWDFASEGFLYNDPRDQHHLQFDRARLDDVDQMVFGVARRSTPEEQAEALQRGDFVLNGGLFFVYRTQNLSTEGTTTPLSQGLAAPTYVRRGFEVYVPDVWLQFLWGDLRLEVEGVAAIGTIDNTSLSTFDPSTHLNILQGAFAFEGEYHLLNRQLGIYFYAGWASGDSDVEGISADQLGAQQATSVGVDHTISTFYFNPAYRVDLIFWRNIMRQIGGAYYFRPGLSYDFIRNNFGQLLGARADVVYSRASNPVQTWGNSADLGLEIDAQVYYRSEDGPDILDGFYASIQYGIFFPFQGLGYIDGTLGPGVMSGGQNAQTLRLILGVQY